MKFFDLDWAFGGLSDTEYDARRERYVAHLASIRAKLPPSLVEFSQSGLLHDALIEAVLVDFGRRQLLLELLGGYIQVGYYALDLRYEGMELDDASRIALQEATYDPKTEALYDELDLRSDGRFEHRILLWPRYEVSIVFQDFDIVSIPRSDRELRPDAPEYIEIGERPI